MREIQVFSEEWFQLHQNKLLWLLNTRGIRFVFRWILRIHKDIPIKERIVELAPHYFTFNRHLRKAYGEYRIFQTTDFRTDNKFAKRLYLAFKPLWWTLHAWDWIVSDYWNLAPQLSFGFSTLTSFPDPSTGATTVDGNVERGGVDQTFAAIRVGAGTLVDNAAGLTSTSVNCSTTSNQFKQIDRSIFTFDTSSITAGATISNAVFSIWGNDKGNQIGSYALHVAGATPASNNVLVAADYSQCQTTSFANIAYASISATNVAYNDFTLNASGIANISKTGISKFSLQFSWDILNDTTGLTWISNGVSYFNGDMADTAGTSNDPKLVVTYSTTAIKTIFGLAVGSVKTNLGLAIASQKTYNGLA